jgi:hypothetical protein
MNFRDLKIMPMQVERMQVVALVDESEPITVRLINARKARYRVVQEPRNLPKESSQQHRMDEHGAMPGSSHAQVRRDLLLGNRQ